MSSSPRSARRAHLGLIQLESREVPAGLEPTAAEQVFLERLNDARANPAAYGSQIGVDLNYIAASHPLAFDTRMVQAARGHSQDLNANAFFSHTGSDGSNPGQRLSAAGYPWSGWAESIAGGQATPESALRALVVDAGVPSLGHRHHLLAHGGSASHRELGIGIVQNGTGPYRHYYTIDSGFNSDSRPYLTGVVYTDGNSNGRYDAGEGLGGATVSVAGGGSVTTWGSGGYSARVGPGTYTVTASGGGLAAPITRTVTVGTANVRSNFVNGSAPTVPPTVPPPAPAPATFADDFSGAAPRSEWRFPNGTWSQAGGVLSQTGAAAGDPKKATLGGLSWSVAQEVTARVRVDAWVAGDAARAGVGVGTDAAGRGYNLLFHGANTVQFLNDGVAWGNAYAFNWQVGAWYRFRLQQDASGVLRGKVWADGAAEPTGWMFTQAGWAARAGAPALNGGSSAGGAYATASFDDVAAGAPGSVPTVPPTVPPPPAPPSDTTGPRVTAGSFSGSSAGSYDRARLTFSEAIDPATFTAADVAALTGPGGAIAAAGVTIVAGTGGTQFDVTFAAQTAAGTYTLTVGPDVRDAAGNQMDQNANGVNGESADRYTVTGSIAAPAPATFADDFSGAAPRSEWRFPNGTWSQAGGVLSQTGAAAGDPKKATLGGMSWGVAQEVTARVRVDAWVAGDLARAGVGVATDAAGRGYNLVFHGANQVQFLHDGVVWGNAYAFNWQVGVWYHFRLRQEADGTLRGKVWADGAAEPTGWMFTQTGWAARAGAPALNGGSSAGGAYATASFDDVAAYNV